MPISRRVFFSCILVFLVLVVSELGSFFVLSIIQREWYALSDLQRSRERRIAEQENLPPRLDPFRHPVLALSPSVIHPYTGYVQSTSMPTHAGSTHDPLWGYGVNMSGATLVRVREPNEVVIGIFGGSVAGNFFTRGGAFALADALKRDVRFHAKTITFTVFALAGYKQPQQLMALNYLLAQGAQFDAVIDLSGFNEIALPPHENIPAQVNPFYPRLWNVFAGEVNFSDLTAIGRIAFLRNARGNLAHISSQLPMRWSYTWGLVWHVIDHVLSVRILEANTAFTQVSEAEDVFVLRGPQVHYHDEKALTQALVNMWRRCAEIMHHLSEGAGFRFFVFLQPNQYTGEKPLSAEERSMMQYGGWPDIQVQQGYPLLSEAVQDMRKAGIHAFDLRKVFAQHSKTLYTDHCCHVGPEGDRIMAEAMAEEILKKW